MNDETKRPEPQPEGDATGGVIPYKNVAALFAYYCAVFSVIPCLALILGPVAFILGIVGFVQVRKRPYIRGTAHAWVGIILGGITTLLNYGFVLFLFLSRAMHG
jgi:hypothetical protein